MLIVNNDSKWIFTNAMERKISNSNIQITNKLFEKLIENKID